MTPKEYNAMIAASGGFTKADTIKRGDHPQPLTKADESALTKAWRKAAQKTSPKSKKRKERETV